MKYFFIVFILLSACTKPSTVLICGDHECVNKEEAKQFFNEKLTIEIRIIDKKKVKKSYDLVELNLKNNDLNKKQIMVTENKKSILKVKKLSKEEKLKKIKEIKKNKKIAKLNQKKKVINKSKDVLIKKKDFNKILKQKNNKENFKIKRKNKSHQKLNDICSILSKCDIDEITKYLIKKGKDKDFPDITKSDI